MSDDECEQIVAEAAQVSLNSLAHDLGSLFAARNANGDVLFTFPGEDGVEERAHRCGQPGCRAWEPSKLPRARRGFCCR